MAGNVTPVTFNGVVYPGNQNFSGTEIYDAATGAYVTPPTNYFTPGAAPIGVTQSPTLNWLWTQARAEWP